MALDPQALEGASGWRERVILAACISHKFGGGFVMEPRDLFDVAVRTLGSFVLVWGLWDLVNAALFYTGYFTNQDLTVRFYLLFGWASIFIGILLIRGGGVLVNFAYGEYIPETDTTEDIAEDQEAN